MSDTHSVQSVGDFNFAFSHPLLNGGAFTTLTGFKLEGELINAEQLIENSKIVPLIKGSITITNSNKSGSITFTCSKITGDRNTGDITEISTYLISQGDSQGGTLRASFNINGKLYSKTFFFVTVSNASPLKLAGNDVSDYAIKWNYADYT